MPSLLLAVVLLLQQAPVPQNEVEGVVVVAPTSAPEPPRPLADAEITEQFNDLLAKEPDRVICVTKQPLGSRINRPVCQTLRGWYDFEALRDTNSMRGGAGAVLAPPYELVDLVKARMRDPRTRAQAEIRAGQRQDAEAQRRADQN